MGFQSCLVTLTIPPNRPSSMPFSSPISLDLLPRTLIPWCSMDSPMIPSRRLIPVLPLFEPGDRYFGYLLRRPKVGSKWLHSVVLLPVELSSICFVYIALSPSSHWSTVLEAKLKIIWVNDLLSYMLDGMISTCEILRSRHLR
ncbi:uncharacterized protein LOC127243896 isoform X2 [Andrographis paniculata]|uniref:uncharacterized protein LOC127243896 isoform X2 n=1 Tax=Andrographis paniculata TaxID=175694 RepID=UPI0021E74841|nr:uncharacterized protein LOC127243896 isoform X2 [Andrographis paniculata]